MKADIHPDYVVARVHCSCGNEFLTRATKPDLHVEICPVPSVLHRQAEAGRYRRQGGAVPPPGEVVNGLTPFADTPGVMSFQDPS
jgi:hypothetical protein